METFFLQYFKNVLILSQVEAVQWTFDNINNELGELDHLAKFLAEKKIDMVINLPMRCSGARRYVNFVFELKSKKKEIIIFSLLTESHLS